MKRAIFMVLFLFLASCSQKEETKTAMSFSQGENHLVYLNVVNAVASSFDTTPDWAPPPEPMAPVDRDMLTRWSSELGLDNEWIYFDFGKPKFLSKIIIKWEDAYAVDYEILASMDAKKWKSVVVMKDQDGGIDEIEFKPVKTRFVKITGIKRHNPEWGFSMWEFEMYGPGKLNPGEEKASKVDIEEKKRKILKEEIRRIKTPLKRLSRGKFQKGVVYTSWDDAELGSIASDFSLVHLKKTGVEFIAIMVPTYQETVDSTEIVTHDYEGGDTPKDSAIEHAIKTAHTLGMYVMLKVHVDCLDGSFRGDIIASEEWFKNYKKLILRYARFAEKNKVDIFCVGTELENTTFSRWENEWRDIIDSVRKLYSGYLVYSANWSEYSDVPFWDMLDFIGIDAYFPLTSVNDPAKEELVKAWEDIADEIEMWLQRNNLKKGVLFTELGYTSSDGTNKTPWATLTNPEDQDEQRDALESVFEVMHKRPWFKGIYIWQYFPQERWSPLGYTIKGKKAEEVLKKWYEKL